MSPKKPSSRSSKPKHRAGRWSAIIPARIRALMAELRLTQAEFASRCGVKSSAVSHWLSGRNLPRAEELRSICNAFEVTADWMLGVEFAPMHRRDWSATDASFAERVAAEMLRDLPPEISEAVGDLAVSVDRVLADARAIVHQEVRELADAMGWADREMVSDFHDAMRIVARLRDWISDSRRSDAGRVGREALHASMLLSEIRSSLHTARPRTFSSSGTSEMRYLRLTASGQRVWSTHAEGAGIQRAWSPQLRQWQTRRADEEKGTDA